MADTHHWLWRLSSDQWLSAAQNELRQSRASLSSRRAAITHARRAGGMALNAVLVGLRESQHPRARQAETMWGRSYQDHLKAVAREPPDDALISPEAQAQARALLGAPVGGQPLVTLGQNATALARSAADAAEALVEICADTVRALAGDPQEPHRS